MMCVFHRLLIFFVAALPLVHCADDPVAYSEVVSLKLSGIKHGDVQNGVASEDKNVNSESGNPYGEFIKSAEDALGGAEPGRVVLTSALVGVHADSKGVIQLEQVFSSVELFVSSGTGTYPVGETTALASSTADIVLAQDVDWQALHPILVGGDFKVGVRVDVVDDVPDDWDAKLFLDLTFSAYE
jgi:hypothetical protein